MPASEREILGSALYEAQEELLHAAHSWATQHWEGLAWEVREGCPDAIAFVAAMKRLEDADRAFEDHITNEEFQAIVSEMDAE